MEDFIDAGYGKLTENADVVQLLIVDRKPNPAGFLRYEGHRARVWRGGALYETSREMFIQNRIHLFGN